ncbi:MAG: hypothetical protein H6654_06955 [Ardenticatenaceae bacterium]|nr:hypothetical protein [Anaerolineales bacterium]MCB8940263.1 hypothetical protein [Ardenticatenaceae bacterium]MCB8973278.1 hypothetical protein [Ardenticatenaceae bacterium]
MSANQIYVAELFKEKPWQWGLRGDPYLWEEMQTHFAQTPLPDQAEKLEQLLAQAFESLTGQPITAENFIAVERFPRSGMSGGMVSPEFWRETTVPLILQRFKTVS